VYTEGSFELDEAAGAPSDRAVARRGTVRAYGQPLQAYATRYGYSLRAIKRWIALGRARDPEDLPPLDDPAEMAAWWERMREAGALKWKVPEVFGASAVKPGKKGGPGASEEAAAAKSASVSAAEQPLGFAAALRRAQEAERLAHERWQQELAKQGDEFDALAEKRRAEAWDRAAKLLESLEVKADKVLGRDFCRMEDVEELVVERETTIRDGLRSVGTRVGTKLALPPELYKRLVDAIDSELDRVFGHVGGGESPLFELAP
jgi:hypothetical protein